MVCVRLRNQLVALGTLSTLGTLSIVLACATAAAVPPPVEASRLPGQSQLNWKESEASIALLNGQQIVWQFNYADYQNKPYFHPVATVSGLTLTWDQPPDHVWHHGMWFSWKYVNQINYWENERTTGKPAGRTQWSNVVVDKRPDFSARITFDLEYVNPIAGTVMTGQRIVEISAPDEDGMYAFDWTCRFTAGSDDVELDRTQFSNEPGGRPWGGYAGLSIRMAQEIQERQAITTREPVTFHNTRYRGKATAVDYTGVIGKETVGIAICDHPLNLNHPTPWYVIAGQPMTFVNAAVICFKPHTLPAGESFTLRYRVLVHEGRWDAKRLAEEHERYVRETQPTIDY